jgi:hypothetical protein
MTYTHKVLDQMTHFDLISALAYHDQAVGLEAACTLHSMIRCLEVKVEPEAMTPWLLQAHAMIPLDPVVPRETTEEVVGSPVVEVLVEEASADLVDDHQIRLVDSVTVISSEVV